MKITAWFRNRKMRKLEETAAYWEGRVKILQTICERDHYAFERTELVEAYAKWRKYKARLEYEHK